MTRDLKKAMLVELRSTGAQTVFSDSAHKETGEAIEWICDNGPAEIDGARLTRLVGLVAASALIARYWPTHRFSRARRVSQALRARCRRIRPRPRGQRLVEYLLRKEAGAKAA
ncbi:MAG: hypothetical protein M3461_12145 [Pseudomonadota bacterium]|nr:hypothetical protein [Pseudomonadota bacterium]